MLKVLGPDKSNWGSRVVRVGNRDTRRLSAVEIAEIVANEEDVVDVEYEFSNSRECYSDDGCNEVDQSSSVDEGLEVLQDVQTAVATGTLTNTIVAEAAAAGLTELSNVVVEEVEVVDPVVEVIEITPFPTVARTVAPTPAPPCSDSPMRFKVYSDNVLVRRNCSWVARKPNLRCSIEGVSTHCPESCWKCGTCVDSLLRFKLTFDNKEMFKSCEWVRRINTDNRCNIQGIDNTCRDTCNTCIPRTDSPSSVPTMQASVSPTNLPTPTLPACYDSPMRFKIQLDTNFVTKSCEWVANHPSVKCQLEGVSSHCPQTCGICDTCADSSLGFKFTYNGDISLKSCEWIGKNNTETLCAFEGITETCRDTCSTCCTDATERFEFRYKGKTMTKSCEWAGRKETSSRCEVALVASNCRKTCGQCTE